MTILNPVFNTLKYSNKLKKAGMEEKLADAQTEALNDALLEEHGHLKSELATKYDVLEVKQSLALTKTELKSEIDSVKKDLIIKLTSIMVVVITIAISISHYWLTQTMKLELANLLK